VNRARERFWFQKEALSKSPPLQKVDPVDKAIHKECTFQKQPPGKVTAYRSLLKRFRDIPAAALFRDRHFFSPRALYIEISELFS
jgi:hypothetical protein